MANDTMNRRNFLGKALGATAALAVVPSVISCACEAFAGEGVIPLGTLTIDLGKDLTTSQANKLKNVFGSIHYTPPKPNQGTTMIITRISATTFNVLSAKCTHAGVQVDPYDNTTGQIHCGGHGSNFFIDGKVKNGPAGSPLKQYNNSYDEATNTLSVTDSILGVEAVNSGISSVSVFPNPASVSFTVELSITEMQNVNIYLVNPTGKRVLDIFEGVLNSGKSSFNTTFDSIPNGAYLLVVQNSNGTTTRAVEVIR